MATRDETAPHIPLDFERKPEAEMLREASSLRERLGESAREVIRRRFAAPAVLDRMEELYRSLIPS